MPKANALLSRTDTEWKMTDSEWIRITSVTELREAGGLLGRSIRGIPLAIYEVSGVCFATLDRCTHGEGRLSDGYLEGFLIECPIHQGLFDVRTGEATRPPCVEPVRTFEVRREGEDLLVSLDSLRGAEGSCK
jgi:nitrite reductase/ring-hydroxylating ferredoxin subunit